jgi:hypothetical protein
MVQQEIHDAISPFHKFTSTPPPIILPFITKQNQREAKTVSINCSNTEEKGYGNDLDIYETNDEPQISLYMKESGKHISKIAQRMKESLVNDLQLWTTKEVLRLEKSLFDSSKKLRLALDSSPNKSASKRIMDQMNIAVSVTDNIRREICHQASKVLNTELEKIDEALYNSCSILSSSDEDGWCAANFTILNQKYNNPQTIVVDQVKKCSRCDRTQACVILEGMTSSKLPQDTTRSYCSCDVGVFSYCLYCTLNHYYINAVKIGSFFAKCPNCKNQYCLEDIRLVKFVENTTITSDAEEERDAPAVMTSIVYVRRKKRKTNRNGGYVGSTSDSGSE